MGHGTVRERRTQFTTPSNEETRSTMTIKAGTSEHATNYGGGSGEDRDVGVQQREDAQRVCTFKPTTHAS